MIFKGIELCCPYCKGELHELQGREAGLRCTSCSRGFPMVLNIPDLRVFSDPYIEAEADRAKGLRLAVRQDELSFAQLVEFYYSITPDVPPQRARRYARGLRAGVARAEAALAAWEHAARANGRPGGVRLLEVGCGTAPLLVAAAPHFATLVGIDIAFRWLVVAQRRLAEAGLDIPLICACAEALPFPDGAFDRVVADSVLEHVRDQRRALAECHRVLRPAGYLFACTPNRHSLGPDPHLGVWGGGLLPQRLLGAYVRWQGGLTPERRLLSARSLSGLIQAGGFEPPRILLPDVPVGQRDHFGRGMRLAIYLYGAIKRRSIGQRLLRWIGPLLHAVAEKPVVAPGHTAGDG